MVKNLPANAGDASSIPGPERSPGEGNGNPFQYSCLENPMDRGAWRATVHGVTRVRHDLTKPPPSGFREWTQVNCGSDGQHGLVEDCDSTSVSK